VLKQPNELDVAELAPDRSVIAGCPGALDEDLLSSIKLAVGLRSLSTHNSAMQRMMESVLDVSLAAPHVTDVRIGDNGRGIPE
jgi:hypothetical protein